MKDYFNHSLLEIPYLGQSLFLLNIVCLSTTLPSSVSDSLLPLFLLTFVGPLIANIYHKYFTLDVDSLIVFIFALVLGSLKLSRVVFNRYSRVVLSVASKTMLVIDVRNRKDDVALYVVWVLINTIIGTGISKIVRRQQLRIADNELMELFGLLSVMCLARKFHMNEFVIIGLMTVLVFFCDDSMKCCEMKKMVKMENDEEESDEKMSGETVQKRKAGRLRKESEDKESEEKINGEKESEEKMSGEVVQKRKRGRPRKERQSCSGESQTVTPARKVPGTPRRRAARKLSFDEEE